MKAKPQPQNTRSIAGIPDSAWGRLERFTHENDGRIFSGGQQPAGIIMNLMRGSGHFEECKPGFVTQLHPVLALGQNIVTESVNVHDAEYQSRSR
jgi:hypothetical protein